MTDHTLLVLCIPVALAAGLLWGIAWGKHRESRRRDREFNEEWAQLHRIQAATRRATEQRVANERLSRSRPF